MAGEWKLTSLREAGVSLIDCDHRTPPAAESGYPYIAIPQLKEGRLDLSDVRRISSEHFVEWTRKARPQHHDVVLSRRCNPGETAYVPAGLESALGQNLVLLRSDGSRVFPAFLRWLVRGPDWWEQIGTFINVGAVFDSLKCADIPNFRMPLPPLAEQKAIAAVLGALDDKIELNRRMNATLEAMARALFQSWFVDFDPVRAKLDGRKPEGLDKATAAVFPSSFQDSHLGPIPKGWISTNLGEACRAGGGDIQTGPFGTQLHASDYVPEGIPSIMPSDLRDNRIDPTSISRIREKDAERLSVYRVEAGDVVYSRRGDVERRSLIRSAEDGWLCGTGCLRVRFGAQGLNSHFGASYLGTLESRAWVVRHAVGATMPNLNTSILGALPMAIPPPELQSLFAGIVGPWDERGTVALEESRSLADLRDALLPKLLSGELRAAGVEQIEEEITR
jgi:type I restriction enzyme S subunit